MLVFAYDGSLNGDWVAHYAVRFAANTSARTLRLVHITDASSESSLDERIARIADESKVLGVVLETELAPRRGANVAERLLEIVPERATLIAGTRARPRHRAFLAGTVSARLLQTGRFSVIAMRVVHPGVLGHSSFVVSHRRSYRGWRCVGPVEFLPQLWRDITVQNREVPAEPAI